MGREQMRNLETFKVGTGQVNEFEYQKNQGQLTEQSEQHPDEQGSGSRQVTKAERVKQVMADAHEKVEKRKKRETGKTSKKKSTTKR